MSHGNKFWIDEAAEKGRLVKKGFYSYTKGPLNDWDIMTMFGWGSQQSVWANPCEVTGLDPYKNLPTNEVTERMGFLFWDAAVTQNHGIKEVTIKKGDQTLEFYSVCGYRQLMPHMHNFTNSSKAIKKIEDALINELVFHLFALKGKSTSGFGGGTKMDVTGYAIRFSELPITPKDNASKKTFNTKEMKKTNRVARGRIYGAILVPKNVVDGVFELITYESGRFPSNWQKLPYGYRMNKKWIATSPVSGYWKMTTWKDPGAKAAALATGGSGNVAGKKREGYPKYFWKKGKLVTKMAQVSGAKLAYSHELKYDPKKNISSSVTKTSKPEELPPEFTESQYEEIDKLSLPVGQYGLSSEETRKLQLRHWSIEELQTNPDLPIPNPGDELLKKLEQYKSEAKPKNIQKSLQYQPYGSIFFEYYDESVDPQKATVYEQKFSDGMYYISILTSINQTLHPDPEFLHFSQEHDETIFSAVRTLYGSALEQVEVIQEKIKVKEDSEKATYARWRRVGPLYYWNKITKRYEAGPMTADSIERERQTLEEEEVMATEQINLIYGEELETEAGAVWDKEKEHYDIVQRARPVPKFPPHRNFFELAESIGYWNISSLPLAHYEKGQDISSWIITVGISKKSLDEAIEADFSDTTVNKFPPATKFDWIGRVGMEPWRVRTFRGTKEGEERPSDESLFSDRYYYSYESEHEYLALLYDEERRHRTRQEATFKLYESLSPPRVPDYQVSDFRYAPMPFSDRAAVLVAIEGEWLESQPLAKGAKPKKVPPVWSEVKLKKGKRPFLDWTKTPPPFPTWHDTEREAFYSIMEAEWSGEFVENEKVDLKKAKQVIGERLFHSVCKHYGKTGEINPRVSSNSYFNYWKSRSNPQIMTEVWLPPRPLSLPRVLIAIESQMMKNLPNTSPVVDWLETEKYSEAYQNDEFLILKIPIASADGVMSFEKRMEIAAWSMRKQANKLGKKKRSSQGMTARELRTASRHVGRFLDQFLSMVVMPNQIDIHPGSEAAAENLSHETACEYYIYLDPVDYSIKDVFAFGYTRMDRGLSAFKSLWRPPHNKAMQFVFWAGMTYIKTNRGRQSSNFGFSDFMNILFDPFGSIPFPSFPDIPGLPPGFIGQTFKAAAEDIKNIPEKTSSGYLTKQQLEDKEHNKIVVEKGARKIAHKKGFYNMNPDTYNPAAVTEEPDALMEGLSNAGCGKELFMNILSKVNLPSLIIMYLKCLGLNLPIDPRCLFNFPIPLFDFNIFIPRIMIPWPISWADIWKIIMKILFQMLCALIIELLMALVKEILESILGLPGCSDGEGGPLPEGPQDPEFGELDVEEMIEEGPPVPFDDPLIPIPMVSLDEAANDTFGKCQPGLLESDYNGWRQKGSALTYLKDVSEFLSSYEFCALLKGEAPISVLDMVIKYTKEYYPKLYFKEGEVKGETTVVDSEPTTTVSATGEEEVSGTTTTYRLPPTKAGSYIGWPAAAGDPYYYRNFFLCLASYYRHWIKANCNLAELAKRQPQRVGDDKCDPPTLTGMKSLQDAWRGRGLGDAAIAQLDEVAFNEALDKMQALDAIEAAIDEFLAVTVPKVTAPVINSVLMNAFDEIFKSLVIHSMAAVERIRIDQWDAPNDLQMMVNFVINARNVEINGPYYTKWRRCGGWIWDRWCKWYYRVWWELPYGYASNYYGQKIHVAHLGDWHIPGDQIMLHDKFKIEVQVDPDPWLWDWIQDIERLAGTWLEWGPHYQMQLPKYMRNLYKDVAHPHGRVHDIEVRDTYKKKDGVGYGQWDPPAWYVDNEKTGADFKRKRGNLGFLQIYQRDSGNLADTMPFFKHGMSPGDGISEELLVSNGKISFSVTLDKEGTKFEYSVWREDGKDLPRVNPMPMYLETAMLLDEKGEEKGKRFPWWENRKVTSENRKTEWIQREEFLARFTSENPKTGVEHPLRSTSFWTKEEEGADDQALYLEDGKWMRGGPLGNQVFADLHLNFYQKEVWDSVIAPLTRSPMENFWLEEYYTATCWSEEEDEDGSGIPIRGFDRSKLKRNRIFDMKDSYFKMGDIRQVAKQIIEDED